MCWQIRLLFKLLLLGSRIIFLNPSYKLDILHQHFQLMAGACAIGETMFSDYSNLPMERLGVNTL